MATPPNTTAVAGTAATAAAEVADGAAPGRAPSSSTMVLAGLDLPLDTVEMEIGGRSWQLACVHDQEALLGVSDRLGAFPFGLLLWDSAPVLADAIAGRGPALAGKRVLELGAGIGLAGLLARHMGAHVRQTDHSEEALAVARTNAARNGIEGIETVVVDWRQWTDTTQYDLIVGSDILYEAEVLAPLQAIFETNLAPGGTLLLTDPCRMHTRAFLARLAEAGWRLATGCRIVPALMPLQVAETVEVMLVEARRGGPDRGAAGRGTPDRGIA